MKEIIAHTPEHALDVIHHIVTVHLSQHVLFDLRANPFLVVPKISPVGGPAIPEQAGVIAHGIWVVGFAFLVAVRNNRQLPVDAQQTNVFTNDVFGWRLGGVTRLSKRSWQRQFGSKSTKSASLTILG